MKRLTVLLTAIALTALSVGCSSDSASTSDQSDAAAPVGTSEEEEEADETAPAAEPTTLTLGARVPPESLDTVGFQEGQQILFAQALYDALLKIRPDGQLEPHIATAWSYNDDLTELTFSLRDDVRFTDGEPVDAHAVVANIEHISDGSARSAQYASSIESAEAIDDLTVRFTLSAPDPALLYSLATYAGFLASPAGIAAGTLAEQPVGSGPYVLDADRTEIGARYTFARNTDYWDAGSYPFDEFVMAIFDDDTAMFNALSSGQIDGMFGTAQKIPAAEAAGLNVASGAPVEWRGLLLNDRLGTTVPALADVSVRQAINHAFDRDGILDRLFEGQGIVTTQVFNPDGVAWVPELNDRYPYDPDRARELLAEAGYPDGFDFPIATFPGLMDEVNPTVEAQLGDVGIRVDWVVVSPTSPTVWEDMLGTPALVMSMGTYLSSWTDLLNVAIPEAMMNPQGIQTPEFDELLERIQTTTGDAQRDAFQEASTYLVEQAWFAPWLSLNGTYFTGPDVTVQMQAAQIVPSLRNFAPAS